MKLISVQMELDNKQHKANDAIALYSGNVMHARLKPVLHRFNYAMSSILIDIDRLDEAAQQSHIFSINKTNIVSFKEKDFGPKDGSPLRPHIDSLMAEADLPPARTILLMCYPRVLGYGFNPISVYHCYGPKNEPVCMIYEVRNTFGESHSYVEPVTASQLTDAGIRQETPKRFYVSPFLDMEMRYYFRVKPPGEKLAFRILEKDDHGAILAASFIGKKRVFSSLNLASTVLQTMGLTWKVIAGIHYEALKLWLKGLKIRPRLAHNMSHSLPECSSQTKHSGCETV